MPASFQHRPDRRSGPILATTLVVFLGALAVAVVVTGGGGNPYFAILAFLGFVVIVPIIGLIFRATPQRTLTSLYSWMKKRDSQNSQEYTPRAVRSGKKYGTNRPPSAEDVRDLKDGTNNWVPSNIPPPAKRRRKA